MKTRQDKANEIRNLVEQINARIAELKEDDFTVTLKGNRRGGLINDVVVTRQVNL